jgi:hypothetical protein
MKKTRTVRTESERTLVIDLEVFESSQLGLVQFSFVLLWSLVIFFLSLLSTGQKTKHQVQSRLLLNVVVTQSAAILQLLTSENQALLVRWNT